MQGYDVAVVPCPSCGEPAQRLAAYLEQHIIGETMPKGNSRATRAGNVKDKHGRYRLDIFDEAGAQWDHVHKKREEEVGRELPAPSPYKEGLKRAAAQGVKLRNAPRT